MTILDALMIPPKSIWDPPDDGSTKSGSPRKHPSDMDEIELRVQLWDSYRLARIILGIPIKSFSLKSKTILHAIRIVAEMKLELIRLQKEVEVANLSNRYDSSPTHGSSTTDMSFQDSTTSLTNGGMNISSSSSSGMDDEANYQAVQKKQEEVLESTRSQLESIAERLQQNSTTTTSTSMNTDTQQTQQDEQTQTDGDPGILAANERSEILEMVQELMKKVNHTSEQLNEQFKEFHAALQQSKQQNGNNTTTTMDTLHKRMRTRQTIHSIELESNSRQHLQQVMDMSGQLESYEEQVERQREALLELTAKYEELESIAVTSEQAREVLHAIEALEEHRTSENGANHDDSNNNKNDNNTDKDAAISAAEREKEVQVQVVEILKRMTIMHSRNQREKRQLDNLLEAAENKERESEAELKHLNLQMELLAEETKIPPEEFAQNMAYQRRSHKKQLTEILRREEKRLLQMEYLEVRLTELAFTAVEIEALKAAEAELKWEQQAELEVFRAKQTEMGGTLKTVKRQVTDLLEEQQETVQQLMTSVCQGDDAEAAAKRMTTKRSSSEKKKPKPEREIETLKEQVSQLTRVRQLEAELAKRDEELARVKDDLRHSQQRVEELEMGIGKYPSDSECTSPLSSRSSS